jgi:hypothetical protein
MSNKWLKQHPRLRPYYEHAQQLQASRTQFSNLYIHEKMLADSARLNAYQRAINKYVNNTTQHSFKEDQP